MYVILLGPPGAGKGTQAALVAEKLALAHITTGELFRQNIRQGTPLGLQAKPYVEQGLLVPDDLTIGMLLERLSEADCAQGCLLDGFPRTLEQARALDKALAQRGAAIDKVLYLRVSTQELLARLSARWTCRQCGAVFQQRNQAPPPSICDRCGGPLYQREDDKPEAVRQRLDAYRRQTAPLIDYYRQAGKLVEVDGEQAVEAVSQELLAVLQPA